jgi:hypothetical protein
MTKAELIDAIKDYPDEAEVHVEVVGPADEIIRAKLSGWDDICFEQQPDCIVLGTEVL